jgi:hypothetical protein
MGKVTILKNQEICCVLYKEFDPEKFAFVSQTIEFGDTVAYVGGRTPETYVIELIVHNYYWIKNISTIIYRNGDSFYFASGGYKETSGSFPTLEIAVEYYLSEFISPEKCKKLAAELAAQYS